ncbi:hypothetical protein [Streptomyces sp. NBC_00878]|uniref:hypothetical protein n=1 Tax=Streptomyces sp. NBC_00878 TaxID=2975854 RepID=UPI0022567645|nr:hypothetical protein [Streptomyces sp. NBC_00878]MCX4910850.1 hypothetical protein [Streptomyces sp. NBC_00878]
MTPTSFSTRDAMTLLDAPPVFDVTHWPLEVERYLEKTENSFHRAILKNYFRHLLLEVSGYWDQIIVPELTVDEPVYRVGDRGSVEVLTGKAAVENFYRETFEARVNVMGARTMNMCVEDFGVTTEARWAHVVPGQYLLDHQHDVAADPDAHYLMNYNIFQIFAYTSEAKLIGERIYVDSASYTYEELAPQNVVTPEQARQALAPLLSRATLD